MQNYDIIILQRVTKSSHIRSLKLKCPNIAI